MSPNHLPLSATLKVMVLSYGDHLSNNILWAGMFIGRNGYGPKQSLTKMVMGRMTRNLNKHYTYAKTKTGSRSASLFPLNE